MKLLFHEVLFVHVDLDGLAGRQFPIPDLIHTTLVLGERELPPVTKVLLQDVMGNVGVNKVLKAYIANKYLTFNKPECVSGIGTRGFKILPACFVIVAQSMTKNELYVHISFCPHPFACR